VSIKAFNPKTKKVYDLGFSSYAVKVNQVDEDSLLDKVDYPAKSKGIDWDFWSWFFSYVVVFVAGLLMPRGLFKGKEVLERSFEDILRDKIKEAKTHKALLQVLLLENDVRFSMPIKTLEEVVYNKGKKSLAQIKEMLKE
jgi:hypothetical protein